MFTAKHSYVNAKEIKDKIAVSPVNERDTDVIYEEPITNDGYDTLDNVTSYRNAMKSKSPPLPDQPLPSKQKHLKKGITNRPRLAIPDPKQSKSSQPEPTDRHTNYDAHNPNFDAYDNRETDAYVLLNKFSRDRETMTTDDVIAALVALGLQTYIPTFKREGVDGHLLRNLDADMLHDKFNFPKYDAMKLLEFASGWAPNAQKKH